MPRPTKVIDKNETATIQVLPKILDILFVQIQITGLAEVGKRIIKKLGTVDINDLIRIGFCVDTGYFLKESRKDLVAEWIIVVPRNLAHEDRIPRHVIPDSGVRELGVFRRRIRRNYTRQEKPG